MCDPIYPATPVMSATSSVASIPACVSDAVLECVACAAGRASVGTHSINTAHARGAQRILRDFRAGVSLRTRGVGAGRRARAARDSLFAAAVTAAAAATTAPARGSMRRSTLTLSRTALALRAPAPRLLSCTPRLFSLQHTRAPILSRPRPPPISVCRRYLCIHGRAQRRRGARTSINKAFVEAKGRLRGCL